MKTLVEVGTRHHIASTSGWPDTWRITDAKSEPRGLWRHTCDLLCHPVYAEVDE